MWELDYKESWTPKNWCSWTVVLEKTLESPLDCKEIKPVNPKGNQSLVFIQRNDAEAEAPILWPTWCEELTHWKRHSCWETSKAGGEGGNRGWDGWIASPTQRTWVWANSRSWWRTGTPGMLQSMGSQRVRHDWSNLACMHACIGKQKKLCDLLYCNIHFILEVWNGTHNISEICLYICALL